MMERLDKKVDIFLKAWETAQSISRSCDESASKVRALALPAWGAIVAYAYTAREPVILYVALALLVIACFVEMTIRHVQYGFIRRSFDIEKALNAYLLDDVDTFLSTDISMHTPTMTIKRFFQLFRLRRAANWLPYLGAAIATFCFLRFVGRA